MRLPQYGLRSAEKPFFGTIRTIGKTEIETSDISQARIIERERDRLQVRRADR
jgi:hypothetical protein